MVTLLQRFARQSLVRRIVNSAPSRAYANFGRRIVSGTSSVASILSRPVVPQGTRIGVVPLSGVGGVGALSGSGRSVANVLRNAFARATGNPYAGKSALGVVTSIGGKFTGALGATIGAKAIASAITGDEYDLFNRGTLLGASGFAVGGVPGLLVGTLIGGSTRGFREAKEIIQAIPPAVQGVNIQDMFPTFPQPNFSVQNIFPAGGEVSPLPSSPLGGFAPAVNFSVGGGGGLDVTPILLALLGGGALGYGLSRRKKKKKKKRKNKKRGSY